MFSSAPEPTKTRKWLPGLLGISLILSIGILWRGLAKRNEAPPGSREDHNSSAPLVDAPESTTAQVTLGRDQEKPAGEGLARLVNELRQTASPEASRNVLLRIRALLNSVPPDIASRIIRDFLSSGSDSPTHQGFVVGPRGQLLEAPTLRTFLLDHLESIDSRGAAQLGREILQNPGSPDEWALALRSVAKSDASNQTRAFLEDRLHLLLSYEPWQRQPHVSYLEAFDVAVHLGGDALMPDLTRLIRMTNNPAVAHAAFLATDRLIQSNPTRILRALLSDVEALKGRESTRAALFARADLSSLDQLQVIESYLLHPAIDESELDAFADVFPNENNMLSQNLLTHTRTRDGAAIRARDVQSLQVIKSWLKDPRFQRITPVLTAIQSRLESFLPPKGP